MKIQGNIGDVSIPGMLNLRWHCNALTMILLHRLALLVGDAGIGKTTFLLQAAKFLTHKSALVVSGSPETEQSHFFGRWTWTGRKTQFVDGPLPAAIKAGKWLVAEEFSQIPLEVRSSLMPLRDQEEITNPLNGETLRIPSEFRLVATSNNEVYACRKNSGIAKVIMDGFMVLEVPELDQIQVGQFLSYQFPDAKKSRIGRVLKLWREYRDISSEGSSGKECLSYRAAAHLMLLLENGMSENQAVQIALVNKFMTSDLFSVAKLKNSISTDDESSTNDFQSTEIIEREEGE